MTIGNGLAKMFYELAKLSIVQMYYIRKYNFSHVIENGWSFIYSGSQLVDATGMNSESWKHRAGILGLSNNPLVIKLLTEVK